MKQAQWFDVDKTGLSKQAEEQNKGRLVGELVQNALDEPGVTQITITLTPPHRSVSDLSVDDDAPEGFKDLTHAYTLFATSAKRDNPEQRGRFNIGEKFVLAACTSASICTTKGTVIFDPAGRVEQPHRKRDRGSIFQGRIKLSKDEYAEVCTYLRSLLLPEGIAVTFNGDPLVSRKPLHTFTSTLETQITDESGIMRPTTRKTTVAVYEPLEGESAHLYEMGLPIVETGDRWHVSIAQKVPLNRDRDNVKPSFLRAVRTAVLNEMHGHITEDDANSDWARAASSSKDCSPEAIATVLDVRFGTQRATYDPSDPEANKAWVAGGGTLVYGAMLSKQEWSNARSAGAIQPAGVLCPTAKPYSNDPDADPATIIPESKWTEGMKQIAEYATMLGRELMGVTVTVKYIEKMNTGFAACYGRGGRLDFSMQTLGRKWFEHGATEAVDRLIIHEFGHEYSSDHLSSDYHEALCKLAAKLKRLALEQPDALKRFNKD